MFKSEDFVIYGFYSKTNTAHWTNANLLIISRENLVCLYTFIEYGYLFSITHLTPISINLMCNSSVDPSPALGLLTQTSAGKAGCWEPPGQTAPASSRRLSARPPPARHVVSPLLYLTHERMKPARLSSVVTGSVDGGESPAPSSPYPRFSMSAVSIPAATMRSGNTTAK